MTGSPPPSSSPDLSGPQSAIFSSGYSYIFLFLFLICKAVTAASFSAFDGDGERPASVDLEAIAGEEGFDRIMEEGQRTEQPVVVWMAEWCRKCIYLKPRLEKLAANFYRRIRLYSIDVYSVPQRLVNRAGVTKMPTIQLRKESKKQGEVIGGHRAWLVVNEVEQ